MHTNAIARAIDALVHMWTDPEFAQEIFAITDLDPTTRKPKIELILAHHGFGDVTCDDIKAVSDEFCALMNKHTANLSDLSQKSWRRFCDKITSFGGGNVN